MKIFSAVVLAGVFASGAAMADTIILTPLAQSEIVMSFSSGGGKTTTCTLNASDKGSVPNGCNYSVTASGDSVSGILRAVENPAGQNVCTQNVTAACVTK